MTDAAEQGWVPWRDCPPDPLAGLVEVMSDAWRGTRLWRPAGPPPEDITGLMWRPCSESLLPLATLGGLYDGDAQPLHGSPPLVAGGFDPDGLWPEQFVIGLTPRSSSGPVARPWLVAPCVDLADVPPVVLGDLVVVADRGETIVMRGLDVEQLRGFAEQVVAMSGGGWS